jgi:hypothetical protein
VADTKWLIEGKWLEYCSCDWGCPCESMAPPSRGHCDGVVTMKIEHGHYGDVPLDNIVLVATFFFPRALHHGAGQMQPIIEDKATPEQRDAIFKILSGEGQPVGTFFNIMSMVVEKIHDPLFLPIIFEWDMAKRTGRVEVAGVVRGRTEPIRNPVTDKEHRILTVLPDGWTFYEAEGASGTAKGLGKIRFDYAFRHSSLARFAFNNNGMAHSFAESRKRFGAFA